MNKDLNAKDAKEEDAKSAKKNLFATFAMHFAPFAFKSPFV